MKIGLSVLPQQNADFAVLHPCTCTCMYRNLDIFRVENISYVVISCSFNFVCSPYHNNMCESFIVEKYSCI